MKLSISNIAWPPENAIDAYALMERHGLKGLEIAPGLTFANQDDPMTPSDAALAAFEVEISAFGLRIVSMQSLLFGVCGAQLFGTEEELAILERGINRAIALAERLSIPNLVFGAPGNRCYPSCYSAADARKRATEVFHRLGNRASTAGTVIAIEPIPVAYKTNFLTTLGEAAEFVIATDHAAITLNFDLGAIYVNGEITEMSDILSRAARKISHVHISEPNLVPAPADTKALASITRTLLALGYEGWFSIEMRRPEEDGFAILSDCMDRAALVFGDRGRFAHV